MIRWIFLISDEISDSFLNNTDDDRFKERTYNDPLKTSSSWKNAEEDLSSVNRSILEIDFHSSQISF